MKSYLTFKLRIEFTISDSDEGTKVDRQPEFTQLDIELSFTDRESIYALVENILDHCWPLDHGEIKKPFDRMTYEEAMSQYGTDKPDTRVNVLTVSEWCGCNFAVKQIINSGFD